LYPAIPKSLLAETLGCKSIASWQSLYSTSAAFFLGVKMSSKVKEWIDKEACKGGRDSLPPKAVSVAEDAGDEA
jgi:hypothetical protein